MSSVAMVAAVGVIAEPMGSVQIDRSLPMPNGDAFARLMTSAVADLNQNIGAAERAMGDLAAGKPVELHEVMISMEQARISVQTFVQVRNRLVESYQDLTRMQL